MIEMVNLFDKMPFRAYSLAAVLIALFTWTFAWQPLWLTLVVASLMLLVTLRALAGRSEQFSSRWLVTLFCGLYAPLGLLLFYEIRLMGGESAGLLLIFTLILMIWGNDMFAYFGGRSFGKHPMAPRISPNKTWEGFASGFAGALTGFLIVYLSAEDYPVSVAAGMPMVLLVSLFGPAGDLIGSRLKRLAGVKDSSHLLPGHGGFLDRFDALIFAAPVVYIYLRWVL